MNRLGGKIILWGIVLGMLVFTAIRTLHFLMQTFPPDQQYVAFLALVAFDVGVLAWFYFATNSAEGAAQRTLAYGMIFVCTAGVIITTVGDMVNVSSQNHLTSTPGWWFTAALWGVILVVVLNVVGGLIVHLVDPKHQRRLAQEEARDSIHKATLASIRKKAGEIAPRVAEQVTQAWEDRVVQEMTGHLPVRRALPSPRSEVSATPVVEEETADLDEAWLARVNARVERERRQRLAGVPDEQLTEEEQDAKWRGIHEKNSEWLERTNRTAEQQARRKAVMQEAARRRVEEEDGLLDGEALQQAGEDGKKK